MMVTIPQAAAPKLFSISNIIPSPSLDKPTRLSFDLAGVLAGLLGGDDAFSAMVSVHVYGNRRWLGWYNTPGSFQILNRLGSFIKSASQTRILSRNSHTDLATLFNLDGLNGPKFRAAHSGTVIEETGHLAELFIQECSAWDSEGRVVPGRKSQSIGVTIADLGRAPASEVRPARPCTSDVFFATIPIAASVGTCALCFAYEDWYASFLILVGIVASGVFCRVLGSADFVFTHPIPAKGSPAGDGILVSDRDMVLLRGDEGAVNAITRGRFSLVSSGKDHYNLIRWCSFLFLAQCITQVLLIPQASFFGQIMFVISIGVSALYNARLSSLDNKKTHRKFLFNQILENPRVNKYTLGTRTSAVVFVLLVLQPQDTRSLLNGLLPNDTKVWAQWKETILEWLRHPSDQFFQLGGKVGKLPEFTQEERDLLALLYEDAQTAYKGYKDYLQML